MLPTAAAAYLRMILALFAVLAPACACRAQDDRPELPQAAWQIESVPDGTQGRISLHAPALDNADASLTLQCRPDASLYEFVLRDSRLARLASHGEVSVAMRGPGREPVSLLAVARGDGSVLVQERVHQMTFSSLLALLSRDDAGTAGLAIDGDEWAFPLQGFLAAMQSLAAQCGFPPDPTRGRRRR